jgi:hypothetical protein
MHVGIRKPNRLRMRTKRKGADDFRKGVAKLAGITKRAVDFVMRVTATIRFNSPHY